MTVNIEHLLDCAAIDSLTHQETIQLCDHIKSQAAEIERLREAITDYLQAQDAVDNNEYQFMPDDFGKLNGRRKAARDDLDAALSGEPA